MSRELSANHLPTTDIPRWLQRSPAHRDQYYRLLNVGDDYDAASADLYRKLLLQDNPHLSVIDDNGTTITRYDGNPIAEVDGTSINVRRHEADYNASTQDAELVAVSRDRSRGIACKGGDCATLVCAACMGAGTQVQTEDGIKAIATLRPRDEVYTRLPSGQTTTGRIRNRMSKLRSHILRLIVGRDTLFTTPEHPFYVPARQRYVAADSLRRGMQLLALTGSLLTITSVAPVDTVKVVENMGVEEGQ